MDLMRRIVGVQTHCTSLIARQVLKLLPIQVNASIGNYFAMASMIATEEQTRGRRLCHVNCLSLFLVCQSQPDISSCSYISYNLTFYRNFAFRLSILERTLINAQSYCHQEPDILLVDFAN